MIAGGFFAGDPAVGPGEFHQKKHFFVDDKQEIIVEKYKEMHSKRMIATSIFNLTWTERS